MVLETFQWLSNKLRDADKHINIFINTKYQCKYKLQNTSQFLSNIIFLKDDIILSLILKLRNNTNFEIRITDVDFIVHI